jgi:L-rhamnonate dehydratase
MSLQTSLSWPDGRNTRGAVSEGHAAPVPIAADQSAFTVHDVQEVRCQQAGDAAALSAHESGRLLAFHRAAAVAEAAGLPICQHGQSVSSIADAVQHHAGLTLASLTEGHQIMHQLLAEDFVSSLRLTPHEGRARGS